MAVGSKGRRGPLALALIAGLVLGLTVGLVAFLVASPDSPAAGAPRDPDRPARSVILINGDGIPPPTARLPASTWRGSTAGSGWTACPRAAR